MKKAAFAAFGVALGILAVPATAAQVTVNLSETYQTIDGLGGFGGMQPWWNNPPYYNQAFLNVLIDTLGLTILRTELYPKGPACGSDFEDETEMWTRQPPYLRALRQKAEASGEPLIFMASVWSPPGGWKSEGSRIGGYLLPQYHTQYAQYLIDYAKEFQDSVGAPLTLISPQNEPGFCFPYNSSCQLPREYSAQVIDIAKYFAAQRFPIPLTYADNVWWVDWLGQCVSWICREPVADSVCSVLSIHYSGGPNDIAQTRQDDSICMEMARGYTDYRTVNRGKRSRLWNTEFGGQFDSWDDNLVDENGGRPGGAWTFARNLYLCLRYNFNAVVYWQLCEPPSSNPAGRHYTLFYCNPSAGTLQLGPLFRVAQQFYRFIRPGMVRVGATSDDNEIWVIAFRHPSTNAFSLVALNTGTGTKTLTVSGTGIPSSFNVRQTSPSQNFANLGTVVAGGNVSLPSRSVTTLYAQGTTIVKPQSTVGQAANKAGLAEKGSSALYGLDGKERSCLDSRQQLAPGAYVVGTTSRRVHVVSGK